MRQAHSQKAALFSALTGLRHSDIQKLRWSEIQEMDGKYRLNFTQKKTKGVEYMPIPEFAYKLCGERQDPELLVFPGLPDPSWISRPLRRWIESAGITRNITFHCFRHTFGTLIQAATGNIETTKKLMGHKSLKSTAIYADVLTEEKVKAIGNTKTIFKSDKPHEENMKIPKTRRTAATNTHPRKVIDIQDNG